MVYDFITDRLRSIRQDLIIQGNPDVTISRNILEISTKFHLYANYKLASQPTPEQGFNKDSNFKQLLECLKTWLSFTNTDELDAQEAIGIYLMLNLGSKGIFKKMFQGKSYFMIKKYITMLNFMIFYRINKMGNITQNQGFTSDKGLHQA